MWYFEYPDLDFMSIANYIRYLTPVRAKLVAKWKVLRICWNLAHLIFQICKSQSWCQKWFLLNIYHLLGTNWSQNWKCSEFIEIWHIWYFEYPDLDFDIKNFFLSNIYQLLQSLTKYLRLTLVFMWNKALREKFNFCFSRIFASMYKIFILAG